MDSIENKYYSIIDKPFIGPYTASSAFVVNAAGTQFVGATFTEVLDFSPPGLPAFTFGNQTYTTFQITALSADYATGFTYSLNGRAQVTITMPLALPITITAFESYFSIVVYATNGNGSTASALQYINLIPPAPVVSFVDGSLTTNGFAVTWPASPLLDPRYTASYSYTVTGQAAVSTTNTSATVSVPTAGSFNTIIVTAVYTYGASVLTSAASTPFSLQLIPAAPTLNAATSVTSTGFTIGWTAQPAPAAGGYTTTYSYSVAGGSAQTTPGTSVTISTGLGAGSNPSFSLSVIYTKTGSPTLTSATTTTNVQLLPPAPTLNAAIFVTTNGYDISWSAAPNAGNASYTTSYSYTVTGQAAVSTTNTSATITGLTVGSYPSITVTARYTYGATTLTSVAATQSVQLIPAAPTLNAATSVTSTGFTIGWAPQPAPAAGGYTTYYAYSVNDGAAQTTTGTSVTISTGLGAGSNPSFKLFVIYDKTGEPTRLSAGTTTNVQLLPPAPTLNAATSITSTGFNITWSAAPNAGNASYTTSYSYTVTGQAAVSTTNTSATVSVPTAGSYPTITLTAIYTYGASVLTSTAATQSVQLLPVAPTLGTPSANSATSFTIAWTAQPAPAAGGYTTSYSYSVAGGTAQTTNGTSVTISTGLIEGSNPSFSLSVVYTSGIITRTSAATTTNVQLLPPPPSLNAETSVTTTGFNISWSAAPNAGNASYTTSYNYTVTGQAAVETTSTNAAITGLTAGSYPSITVRAVYTYGASVLTSTASTQNVQLLPVAPTLGAPSNIGLASFTIGWTAQPAPAAGGYTTTYSYSVAGGSAQTTTGTSVTISSGLIPYSNSSFSMSVVYTLGAITRTSAATTTNVQLQVVAPTINAATSVTTTGFDISWSSMANPAYTVSYSYIVTGKAAVTTSSTSATITGLTANSYPSFSVTAIYTYGASVLTSTASTQNFQLLPPATTLGTPISKTSTSFDISWTAQFTPIGPYTVLYSYSVNGGAAQTTTGTTASVSTGLTAGSNPSFSVSVVYTPNSGIGAAYPPRTSAATTRNILLRPDTLYYAPNVVTTFSDTTVTCTPSAMTVPPTGYGMSWGYVSAANGGILVETNTSPITFSGLTASTRYYFAIYVIYKKNGDTTYWSDAKIVDVTTANPGCIIM